MMPPPGLLKKPGKPSKQRPKKCPGCGEELDEEGECEECGSEEKEAGIKIKIEVLLPDSLRKS